MPYRIAGIDVHKKMLAVVIADVAVEGEYSFERRKFGATPAELQRLARWLVEQEVQEAVMESTAQYWRPVWATLEQYWMPVMQRRGGAGPKAGKLHLAQALSNRGPRGRKNDFRDAERLLRRLVAQELVLSFVPDPEQRLWRTVTRRKSQFTQDRVRFQNRLESLLEQMHIKLSGLLSDLLGVSGRRMLKALAEGATDPAAVAALADPTLRATPEQLCDALAACVDLLPVYRRLLKMELGATGLSRTADGKAGRGDCTIAASAFYSGATAGGRARFRGRVGATDHRRNRSHGSRFLLRQTARLVGRSMPRGGGDGGRSAQHALAERQPQHAPPAEPSGPCCGQDEGQHF